MANIFGRRSFWLFFFLVLLLFAAAVLFVVAEYNTYQSGYTPEPPIFSLARQIMDPLCDFLAPVLRWIGIGSMIFSWG